jgi:hypothetical protein
MKKIIMFLSILILVPQFTRAANIDTINRYAWGQNIGWVDFGLEVGNIEVSNNKLTGYAYSSNTGWISLNCVNTDSCKSVEYGVTQDGKGDLSGYAWGQNTGWIDFSGVSINEEGDFLGYAYSPNIGYISFNCVNTQTCDTIDFKVTTTWTTATSTGTSTDNEVIEEERENNNSNSSRRGTSGSKKLPRSNVSQTQSGVLSSEIILSGPSSSQPSESSYDLNRLSSINMDLYFGMTHPHVKRLQQLLNSLGYNLAESGPGSLGNETEYFGSLTQTALAKYQADNNIVPALGYFGPITRAFLALKGF